MTEPDPPIFRLHEARAMLPRVGALLAAMQQRKRQAQQARAVVDALRRAATGNGGGVHADTRQAEARLQAAVQRLQALAAELEQAGVQLKDLGPRPRRLAGRSRGPPRPPLLAPGRAHRRLVA